MVYFLSPYFYGFRFTKKTPTEEERKKSKRYTHINFYEFNIYHLDIMHVIFEQINSKTRSFKCTELFFYYCIHSINAYLAWINTKINRLTSGNKSSCPRRLYIMYTLRNDLSFYHFIINILDCKSYSRGCVFLRSLFFFFLSLALSLCYFDLVHKTEKVNVKFLFYLDNIPFSILICLRIDK